MDNVKKHKHYFKIISDNSVHNKLHKALSVFGPKSLVLVLVECALNLLNSVCSLSSHEITQLKKHHKFLYNLSSLNQNVKFKRKLLFREAQKKNCGGLRPLCHIMLRILEEDV